MICKYCFSEYDVEVRAKTAYEKKRQNAINSAMKAKANGNKGGRKKIRDDKKIRQLRLSGLTIRQIAAEVNLSTTAVQRSLKETEGVK